jgi:S-DNA-T family DNA segregation ATPase FtsK/SpoIIIE
MARVRKQYPELRERQSPTVRKESGDSTESPAWVDGAVVFVLFLAVYFLASLYTDLTGAWGQTVRNGFFGITGGGVVLLLVFVLYCGIFHLLRKPVQDLARQAGGTIVLYLCLEVVLFIGQGTWPMAAREWLNPGLLGKAIGEFLLKQTGVLGIVLAGLFGVFLSAALYGLIEPLDFVRWAGTIRDGLFSGMRRFKVLLSGISLPMTEKLFPKTPDGVSEPETAPLFSKSGTQIAEPPEIAPLSPSFAEEETDDLLVLSVEEAVEQAEFQEECPLPEGIDPSAFPPPLELFGNEGITANPISDELIRNQGERIISTLEEFGVEAELAETITGPTVIQFRLQLAPGIKVSKVAGLSNDLAVALAVPALRVEAPIPGTTFVGIETPNPRRWIVPLRALLESTPFQRGDFDLPLPLGLTVDGVPLVMGLEDLPHLLVAGTTGSGKSVLVSSCIIGLCCARRPDELRLLLIDPKRVEMTLYEKLPHTLTPPVVDSKKAVHALGWAIREMERRYELFAGARVRHLKAYNRKVLPKDRLPHIVIVVDELADLMMTSPKEAEDYICRLAQMARATGIHLILATQRPSVNVVTGLIKANIPARVAFTLPSQADSRTIIDLSGAEKLLGKGDMLLLTSRYPKPLRVQGPWIDESRITGFIQHVLRVFGEPQHIDIDSDENGTWGEIAANLEDPLLEEAVSIILQTGIASASRLQRQLKIGFTRAARLIDTMEQLGMVGPQEASRPREILVDEDKAEEILRQAFSGGG